MADQQMPVIPKVEDIFIHSGNICTWNRMKKKLNQAPNVEAKECLSLCLNKSLESCDRTSLQYESSLMCAPPECIEKLPVAGEERDTLKLSVKIFLSNPNGNGDQLRHAIEQVREDLGVAYIDNLLVSFPPAAKLDDVKDIWGCVSNAFHHEFVHHAGVSDMDKNEMELLYDWAEVKPSTDQVNLSSCCVMPADLVEYAKLHDIQLLTHNDPPELMTVDALREMISEEITPVDSEGWHLDWLVRYSVLVKQRGIIQSKGYMLKTSRDTKTKRIIS